MEDGIVVRVGVGDVHAVIAAEGSSYSPDLVHDMVARAIDGLGGTIQTAIELGYIPVEDEDDEEGEVTDLGTGIEWL